MVLDFVAVRKNLGQSESLMQSEDLLHSFSIRSKTKLIFLTTHMVSEYNCMRIFDIVCRFYLRLLRVKLQEKDFVVKKRAGSWGTKTSMILY